MMFIFNEEKYAKDLLTGKLKEMPSLRKKIDLLSRLYINTLQKSNEDTYNSMVNWLNKHHECFYEQNYSKFISEAINRAKKKPFYNIKSINITEAEFETIRKYNNLRYEKILFVLLCLAKFQRDALGFENNLVAYDISNLFKAARVSVKASDRENILHDLLINGEISLPFKNDSRCLFVNFVNENETVKFSIDEKDCNELAYLYLIKRDEKKVYKGNVFRCNKCGKLTKQSKKYGDICQECKDNIDEPRKLWCINCGTEFVVGKFDSQTCRCEDCQHEEDKKNKREWWKKNKNKLKN